MVTASSKSQTKSWFLAHLDDVHFAALISASARHVTYVCLSNGKYLHFYYFFGFSLGDLAPRARVKKGRTSTTSDDIKVMVRQVRV
jgi:hypothetical protein